MTTLRFSISAGLAATQTAVSISGFVAKEPVTSGIGGGLAVLFALISFRECASEIALWLRPLEVDDKQSPFPAPAITP